MRLRLQAAEADIDDEVAHLMQSTLSMGWGLQPQDAERLTRYLDLLQRWNAVYNLTSVRDRAEMRTQHLVDCLSVIAPLRRVVSEREELPKRLLDVGSGGGLPGVVVALLFPNWQVVCVDSVGKKAAFVRQVATELKIPNLDAVHSRVESLLKPTFGVITARAFSTLQLLTQLTQHLLAPAGVLMAMKAKLPESEMADIQAPLRVFHVEQLKVPTLNAPRCIVWIDRGAPSNDGR